MASPLHTTVPSGTLPSFFELHMSDRIQRALPPAFAHLVQSLVANAPVEGLQLTFLTLIAEYMDESHALLAGLVQAQNLATHGTPSGATDHVAPPPRLPLFPSPRLAPSPTLAPISDALLAERFYLLRRSAPADGAAVAPAGGGADQQQRSLSGRDRFLALLLEVALPYLKVKIDRTYAQGLTRRAQSGPSSRSNERRSFRLLMFLYPFLHISYEGSNVLSQWLFMIGASPYFSVSQRLLRQRLNRASELDKLGATGLGSSGEGATGVRAAAGTAGTAAGSTSVAGQPPSNTGAYIRMALVGAAVCYKALEWWYSTGTHIAPSAVAKGKNPRAGAVGWLVQAEGSGAWRRSLPQTPRRSHRRPLSQQNTPPPHHPLKGVPPVPQRPPLPPGGLPIPLDDSLCPLCHRARANTAVAPSGYVFCYACLAAYVREHRRCPVTHVPCGDSAIRRIYDGD